MLQDACCKKDTVTTLPSPLKLQITTISIQGVQNKKAQHENLSRKS